MRTLFLTPAFPPLWGGGERYAYRLGQQFLQGGHHVTVITSQAKRLADFYQGSEARWPTREVSDGMEIIRLPVRPLPGGRTALLAWRKGMILLATASGCTESLLRKMSQLLPPIEGLSESLASLGAVDVVHSFNLSWEYPALVGWYFAREKGLPYVLTPFLHIGRTLKSRVARNMTMPHQIRLIREADALLALTSVEKAALEALGANPGRIYVVGSGMDDPPSLQAVQEARQEIEALGLPRPFALYIGRLERDKGAILAVEAVRRLNRPAPRLGLVLVGERTPTFDRYWRALPEGARQGVFPLGNVSEPLKHALLEEGQMLLLPSEVESFGLVILEAWSHKKPVIAARAGGISGVVGDGKTGLLVPPGDVSALAQAIVRLLEDASLAKQLGEAGHSALGAFTWAKVYEQTLLAYRAVIATRKG